MNREVSQKDIAVVLGLSTRQIRNLESDGLPHRAEGNRKYYPVADCVAWIRDRDVDAAVASLETTDYDEQKAREMKARADKAEMEVKQMRRELLHSDDWEAEYASNLSQIRASLLSLPGRIVAELPMPAVDALEIIEPIVHEFMQELSEEPLEDDDDPT